MKASRGWHHFSAPVVGIQVGGALSVVCPGSVDAEHLLPVTRCVTAAVGPSWRPRHSQHMGWDTEEVWRPPGVAAQAHTSVVEVIDVLWTQDGNQLICSAVGPADDAVPLRHTVTVFQTTNQNSYLNECGQYKEYRNTYFFVKNIVSMKSTF